MHSKKNGISNYLQANPGSVRVLCSFGRQASNRDATPGEQGNEIQKRKRGTGLRRKLRKNIMREIKFRVWDIENKIMSLSPMTGYSEFVDLNEQIKCFQKQGMGKILMQFTGLLDKNGKEICEGDIMDVHGDKAEVYYDENNVCFGLKSDCDYNPCIGRYEIIGNIYQNKELLK